MSEVAARAKVAELDWAAIGALSDAELEAKLYPKPAGAVDRPLPDPAKLDIELRKTGVTLRLLHHEYLEHFCLELLDPPGLFLLALARLVGGFRCECATKVGERQPQPLVEQRRLKLLVLADLGDMFLLYS